jgi:hypothetical protein
MRELSGADDGLSWTDIAAALLTGAGIASGGEGAFVEFAAGCASAGADATPSFVTGVKPAPVVGVLDASSTDAAEAAGGLLFEAQAAASVLATKMPQDFFIVFFLRPA